MNVSVAIATYNGEKYIGEQIKSILCQLGDDDEIVVSDDGSKDKTIEILNNFKDKRIKVVDGPKMGIKQNFNNAILKCSGEYIFLADQDDVWIPNKVNVVLDTFRKNKCACVVHDAEVFESNTGKIIEPSFFAWRKSGSGTVKNIWKNTYIGCCMAFKSSMKKYILPIPNDINMHDQWIGVLCEKYGKSVFIPKVLVKYRRHKGNNSEMRHGKLWKMMQNRVVFLRRFLARTRRTSR